MPFSYAQYPGNGSTVTFTVPFPYLLRAHVKLYYGLSLQSGGYTQLLVDGVNYSWTSATQVQLTAAPVVGQTLSIRRETPTTSRLVDWNDGSALTADALDTADLQNFYAIQEHKDYIEALSINPNTNVADGSITANKLSSDAVTTIKIQDQAVTSGKIADGAILDVDVNAGAGIAASKLSFTQSGGSARTVDAKLKDTVSPADFGAVGNNSTDDTSALAAVRAAFSNTSIDLAGASYRVTAIPAGWGFRNGLLTLAPGSTDDQPANEAYGYGALAANTYIPKQHSAGGGLLYSSGNFNTAFGAYSLAANTTGRRQTAFGSQALRLNTSGFYNTAVGSFALSNNLVGNYNTSVGNQSLSNCTGSSNTAVGNGALLLQTNGADNVAIGDSALAQSASCSRNIAIGKQAAWYTTGSDSVAIGHQALSASPGSGPYNVAVGSAAMGSCSTGDSNTAVGRRAMSATTTGSGNVAIGNDAMVGSGVACTGSNNVAVGNTASANITTGYQNVSIGVNAGTVLSTGFNNTSIGRFAAQATTTGAGNVAIGEQSLSANTTGDYNTAVGAGTAGGTNYTNTTMLGYTATVTGSNQLQLGNASVTSYSYGAVQNRSDARDKADIQDTVLGLDFINALRPVDFRWDMRDYYRTAAPEPPAVDATEEEKAAHAEAMRQWRQANTLGNLQHDGSKKRTRFHHGLIAQEVRSACDSLGIDFGGYQDHSVKGGEDVLSIGYEELIAPLIKAVQQLSAEVEQLRNPPAS